MNPDLFTIEQKKLTNLWPEQQTLAKFLSPYVKRLKTSPNLIALDYATLRGETAYELLENCENILKIYCVQNFNEERRPHAVMYNDLVTANLIKNRARYELVSDVPNTEYDIVCINSCNNVYDALTKSYSLVKTKGIIGGTDYSEPHMKNEVVRFRRDNKIGININIYNNFWFWYKG